MYVFPANLAAAARSGGWAAAGDTLRPALDPAQLLDVDVDQLARPLALIAAGWLEAEPAAGPPDPESTADTVDKGIPITSAISAPVIRNRRRDAIASTRSSTGAMGTEAVPKNDPGAPRSPSAR